VSELSDRLRDWDTGVRRLAEQAEARINEANAIISDLHQAGRTRSRVLLGAVMSVCPYDPGCGPEDSGQVTQAVLLVPEGLGVVFWDTEDYSLCSPGRERQLEARRLFTPIAACRPLLRVQFLPFAIELLTRLVQSVNARDRR
jgi:hypothetical protein